VVSCSARAPPFPASVQAASQELHKEAAAGLGYLMDYLGCSTYCPCAL
jgi:hypothetical protein